VTFQHLHAAANTDKRQRAMATSRQNSALARLSPSPSPQQTTSQESLSWLALLNECERAEADAVQASVKERRQRGLHQLAQPDLTGKRRATFEWLRAAVHAEMRLRAAALRRKKRVAASLPPEAMAAESRSWLAFLDDCERAELSAAQSDIDEWRQRRLDRPEVREQYLSAQGANGRADGGVLSLLKGGGC
jgi:hypothetical protein